MMSRLPAALQHRRYRLLWFGLLFSIVGNRMQFAAVLWHINTISGEAIALGGLGLVQIVPILFFSLMAGTVADAVNRRSLMFLTQGGLALMSLLLGWLTLRGVEPVGLGYLRHHGSICIHLGIRSAGSPVPGSQPGTPRYAHQRVQHERDCLSVRLDRGTRTRGDRPGQSEHGFCLFHQCGFVFGGDRGVDTHGSRRAGND